MGASYNKIDYRIRVAKSVERRMMCSLFQRLSIFHPLNEYKYIGFGSVSFIDFALFHKILGINNMISIEKEEHDKKRFEFNKPYDCIDLQFGESNNILPGLDIEHNSLIWLDYDGKLSTAILDDIRFIFNRLSSGSFFCVSYNAHQDEGDTTTRVKKLSDRIDNKYFPDYLHESPTLHKTGISKTYYDIIQILIQEVLTTRKANGDEIFVQQLLFFSYSDGVEMNTLGWLFYNSSDSEKAKVLKNNSFPFICEGNEAFRIAVPMLTHKEMKQLESKFPDIENCLKCFSKGKDNMEGILDTSDIENYYKIYKSFSLFAEIHL